MQFFTSLFFALFAAIFASVKASPVEIESLDRRDVFVPPVLYPHAGTVWKAGGRHNVTWSLKNAPVNITNGEGMIILAKGGRVFVNQTGGLNHPLASNFSILDGRIEITVPKVKTGSDYQVVLFGDSGNLSHNFTIKA